MNQSTNESLVD